MITARSFARSAARSARVPRAHHQVRLQSTASSSAGASQASSTSPYLAGAVGGVAAGATLYGIYLMTPSGKMARSINKTTKEAHKKYQEAAQKLQQSTPDADQAAGYVKDLCYSYISWIPGGRQYVDAAFRDLDKVRKNHKDEADAVVRDAYEQLREVSKGGLSLDTARRALDVLASVASKAAELGGDALADVLEEHPQAREKLGGGIDELRRLGEQYGPEAKKQVDETWRQLVEAARDGGLSADSIGRVQELLREKTEQVRRLGDDAWKKGLEEARPLLDKSPRVKKLVEENADALRQGNAKELFGRARKAVESGEMGDLEGYVRQAVDKVKSKVGGGGGGGGTGGLEQYLDALPSGGEILPKLQQLRDVAGRHTDESEKLVRETVEELKQVLESKSEKAKEILEKAKRESK